jgi:hypothetical protein
LSTPTCGKTNVLVTVGAWGAASVTAAFPTAEASATDVAVIVTVPADTALAADVYVTAAPDALVVGEIEPQAAPVQLVPEIDQITPRFCASFATFAVKVCVTPPVGIFAVPGVTDTLVDADVVNAIDAEADFDSSVTEVAVSVIVPVGAAVGAV